MNKEQPNIVFMHVDQMHAEAMSAYGNPYVRTPNLDRIAADGISFMASYCTMPQCCPARASWYTGRMSKEHGVVVNSCPIRPEIPDLGQWLQEHGGYESIYAGKWHVSGRNVRESFHVLLDSGQGEVNDTAVARSAVAYLQNRRNEDKPFFLNIGFMNPHDCCYTAGASGGIGKFAFADEIEEELPPLPNNFQENAKYRGRTTGWGEIGWRYYIYSYYRLVEMVDAEIGKVYGALMRSPYCDNTLFIFTADHGDGLGFHGNVSKGFMEEEAWRVPAMAVFPEHIFAGQMDSEHLVSGVDIPATICDYAGVPMLPKMTIGQSWRPLFEGRDTSWREYIVGETSIGRTSAAIRDSQFKTIFHMNSPLQIYDIKSDPLEQDSLIETSQGAAIEARHRKLFRNYTDKIELCPEPTWGKLEPRQRKIYQNYLEWYESI